MGCKISRFQLVGRRQYHVFAGKPVVGSGGYPYVLAQTVPQNRYWLLWFASCISGNNSNIVTLAPELIVIPNGANLPILAAGSNPDDPFFLNYKAFPGRAFGPAEYGLRVDQWAMSPAANNPVFSNPGDEIPMLRHPILVGQGETLMGWSQQYGTPSDPGVYLELRICYTELLQTEDFQL
jgi:hypothetical protein